MRIDAVHLSTLLRNLCCCDCQNRQYALSGCFGHRYVAPGVVGGDDLMQLRTIFALSSVSVEHNVSVFRRKTEAEFPPLPPKCWWPPTRPRGDIIYTATISVVTFLITPNFTQTYLCLLDIGKYLHNSLL